MYFSLKFKLQHDISNKTNQQQMRWIENVECPFVDIAFFAVVKVNDGNRQIHEQIHIRFEKIPEQYRYVSVSSGR